MKPSQTPDWQSIPGWCSPVEADYLYQLAAGLDQNDRIVEVGSYLGRSACAIGLGCRESGARLITIDHFRGNPEHQIKPTCEGLRQNLARLGVLDWVEIMACEAREAAENIERPIHALFIDDQHDYGNVMRTSSAFIPRLISGGHVLWHDAIGHGWIGVERAVSEITKLWHMQHVVPHQMRGSISHWRLTGPTGCKAYG